MYSNGYARADALGIHAALEQAAQALHTYAWLT